MSELPSRAVFISYASQDAPAARALCDALRAGGLEVWFDQNELRGGDAWDQKIKRQIRDCGLFLPIISPATQARPEGYFRREWKQAVERMQDMAEGSPFLVPVALDGVSDRQALVPDAFLSVQWMRAKSGELPTGLVDQVTHLLAARERLLSGATLPPTGGAPSGLATTPATKPTTKNPLPPWAITLIAVTGACSAFAIAIGTTLNRKAARESRAPATTAAEKTVAQPTPTPPPAEPATSPSKILLARFENLSGDPAVDASARLIESELIRAFGQAPHLRVEPSEASTRTQARDAARQQLAGLIVQGQIVKAADGLSVSAEVRFAQSGAIFGTLGPTDTPLGLRGAAWTEFTERLVTGVSNASVHLQNPPKRIEGVIYPRPWPRWSTARRAQEIRALPDADARIAGFKRLLEDAPDTLRLRLELARLFRDEDRFDDAERELTFLQERRSQLSAIENYEVLYDQSLLAGQPDQALNAARGILEIQDSSSAITQVIAGLWALNRPRAASQEIDQWWAAQQATISPANRPYAEFGVLATRIAAHLASNELSEARAVLDQLKALPINRHYSTATWQEAQLDALSGDADALIALAETAGTFSGSARVEPAVLAAALHGQLLHAGHPTAAAKVMAFAAARMVSIPAAERAKPPLSNVDFMIAESEHRYDDAFAILGKMEAKTRLDELTLDTYRALLLIAQGRVDETRAIDQRLAAADLRNTRGLPLYLRARLAAARGEASLAISLLEQAIARGLWLQDFRVGYASYGRSEPEFAPLRGNPAYERLIKPKD